MGNNLCRLPATELFKWTYLQFVPHEPGGNRSETLSQEPVALSSSTKAIQLNGWSAKPRTANVVVAGLPKGCAASLMGAAARKHLTRLRRSQRDSLRPHSDNGRLVGTLAFRPVARGRKPGAILLKAPDNQLGCWPTNRIRQFVDFYVSPWDVKITTNSATKPPRESEDTMKNLATKVQRFLVSEDGPTAVEYAVMLALIVIVCLTAIRSIGTNASATFNSVSAQLGS